MDADADAAPSGRQPPWAIESGPAGRIMNSPGMSSAAARPVAEDEMTTPSAPDSSQQPDDQSAPPVDLGKRATAPSSSDPAADAPFDPYRFGKPDHPVPPEFAPPGYVPDEPVSPYPAATNAPYGQSPYGPSPYGPPPSGAPSPYGPPYPGGPYPGGGPASYGAPPPPPYHAYGAPPTGNGKAVAALVLGIVSLVMFWLIFIDAIFIILALIFGILALTESRAKNGSGRGMAIAGLVCAGLGTVATVLFTVVVIHAADKCGGFQTNSSDFKQCVQDHL